jgi:hypothetical protein
VQNRYGADKLAVALIDVDPGYFDKQELYLPQAKKILDKQKLSWPNALAAKGFTDTVRTFNVSGYGTIVVDGKGIVRGVNVHGKELERLIETIMGAKKAEKPSR